MYYCIKKINRKIIIFASWDGGKDSCLNTASDCFSSHGFSRREYDTTWGDIPKQKNFGGYAKEYIVLTDNIEQVNLWTKKRLARDYFNMYDQNLEEMRKRVPEYIQYLD